MACAYARPRCGHVLLTCALSGIKRAFLFSYVLFSLTVAFVVSLAVASVLLLVVPFLLGYD